MGKRLRQQRRGSGSPAYRSPSTRYKVDLQYRAYDDLEKAGMLRAKITDFIDDPGRDAIVMEVLYDNGEKGHLLAHEGAIIGEYIEAGAQAKVGMGNLLPLYRIPDGAYIFNLERNPGDRGKLIKAPGSYATIVSREKNKVFVKLPSRRTITLSADCRAQLGIVSGGGRSESPLLKAGNAFHKYKTRNRLWPKNRGVKMSVYCHPFGGKQHHEGKPTTVSRGASPGRKVGHIAARSTGRKKSTRADSEGRSR
ncbi:50S ribosomal protein L2 [Candidatus Micrarchaeota archaeon]|nr:50S ribosomal protein L2 [Candidatus Micrarchaeota archaeon]